MDERHRDRRVVCRTDGPHGVTLGHGHADPGRDRAQMRQGDREPVGRCDGDRPARPRHHAGERHDAACRRLDDRAEIGADVDPAMLARRVRIGRIEHERLQHRPLHRPGPRASRWGEDERRQHRHHPRQRPQADPAPTAGASATRAAPSADDLLPRRNPPHDIPHDTPHHTPPGWLNGQRSATVRVFRCCCQKRLQICHRVAR